MGYKHTLKWYETLMYAIEKSIEKILIYLQFLDFDIFSSSKFTVNMNVSLPSNNILPYFKDILEDAWSLQNYGDYFVEGLRQELCALESSKMHTKIDKSLNFYCCVFLFIKMGKNTYIT